jgi:type IV pilus assembly protein PilA
MYKLKAFTLIELMVVMAIIGMIAVMSMPIFYSNLVRSQVSEAIKLSVSIKDKIELYYLHNQKFPENNLDTGVPPADKLISNFITYMQIENGALHIKFGNNINSKVKDKILTIRPMVVEDSPESPISWVCGYAKTVKGMRIIGENKSNINKLYLPIKCY